MHLGLLDCGIEMETCLEPIDFLYSVPEPGATNGGQVKSASPSLVETRVKPGLSDRGFGIKLHAIAFHAHNRTRMMTEQDVRNLSEHGIG